MKSKGSVDVKKIIKEYMGKKGVTKISRNMNKIVLLLSIFAVIGLCGCSKNKDVTKQESVESKFDRVSVHDPSVVEVDGTYYIFGSHMAWAKSTDLMNWESFTMNINKDYDKLFGQLWEDYCYTKKNPQLKGNLWAPDVIFNKTMNKYCMYMSVNGSDYNSAIVLLTADQIEGPYEYVGPVVYSGFNETNHDVKKTDVYKVLGEEADIKRYQNIVNTKLNCIDPCVTYDKEGNLWMSFGSWFGGIYMLKLDETTGLRDYNTTYETVKNESDAYYGYKLAGGNKVSGEGSYIINDGDYYYLFLSYGGLTAEGGYQMREYRSENIYGPYVDQNGESAIYTKHEDNLLSTKGIRIMASYNWTNNRELRVAQGHNSVCKTTDGKIVLVYHSRFAKGKNGTAEAHEVRVQQMIDNQEGWLVCVPYEYTGESLSEKGYSKKEMAGDYEFVIHVPNTYFGRGNGCYLGVNDAYKITLQEDGTVTGDLTGNWTNEDGKCDMTITVDGIMYKGKFIKAASEKLLDDPAKRDYVMTFTVLGNNVTAWGSKY